MSRMATVDAFLNTCSKRPCKYHFVGQFEIAYPGLCMSYASQKRRSTHANFHAFQRPRRGSSSQDVSRPIPFLVRTNGMLVVSPLGVKLFVLVSILGFLGRKAKFFIHLSIA